MIFVFFQEFVKFFQNSKKKCVQELLALTFHDIVILKNFNNVQIIEKVVFFGLNYFGQSRNSEKNEFCDSPRTDKVFEYHNITKSWSQQFRTYFFLNFWKTSRIREKRKNWSEFPKMPFLHRFLNICRVK